MSFAFPGVLRPIVHVLSRKEAFEKDVLTGSRFSERFPATKIILKRTLIFDSETVGYRKFGISLAFPGAMKRGSIGISSRDYMKLLKSSLGIRQESSFHWCHRGEEIRCSEFPTSQMNVLHYSSRGTTGHQSVGSSAGCYHSELASTEATQRRNPILHGLWTSQR